ncbi:MFS drug efflux transporter [Xylariomycetidae sp. FL2044]|nr:MFS drug efflux transporter [Xylariomycetidae sp. FL2044]
MEASVEKHERSSTNHGENSSQELATQASPRQVHGWKWAVVYMSILTTVFLFALDNTIVAAIQVPILDTLGHVELLPWIGTGFALGSTAILPWGKAYGLFSVKWLFVFNIFLFEVGSAICGAAPNMTAFIIGRVIAGVGGCGMYSGSLSYIAFTTSLKERSAYMGGSAVIWGLGSVLGSVVGGGFATSSATWRWAFYINLVIGAVFAPAYLFLLPNVSLQAGQPLRQRLGMIDWVGTTIFIGGSVCFTMAITFSGLTYPWSSGSAIALWTMTGVLLLCTVAVTIWHPLSTKETRLIPAHFFKRPEILNLGLQTFLASGVMLSGAYYIPLFFTFTEGDEAMEAGIRLLPFICLLVFFSLANGITMPQTGRYFPWFVAGSVVSAVGSGLMTTVGGNTPSANVYGYTALVGAGIGSYVVAGFSIIQALVPVEDIASAVGFAGVSQILGTVTFLAVSGSVMSNTAASLIAPLLPPGTPSEFAHDLVAGTSSAAFQSLDPDLAASVVAQVATGIRNVWILNVTACALSAACALFLGRKKLNLAG